MHRNPSSNRLCHATVNNTSRWLCGVDGVTVGLEATPPTATSTPFDMRRRSADIIRTHSAVARDVRPREECRDGPSRYSSGTGRPSTGGRWRRDGWRRSVLPVLQEPTKEQLAGAEFDRRHPRTSPRPAAVAIIMRWAPEVPGGYRRAAVGRRLLAPKRAVHEPARPAAGGGGSDGGGNQTEWTDVYGRSMTVDAAGPFNDGRSFIARSRPVPAGLPAGVSQSVRADSSFFSLSVCDSARPVVEATPSALTFNVNKCPVWSSRCSDANCQML